MKALNQKKRNKAIRKVTSFYALGILIFAILIFASTTSAKEQNSGKLAEFEQLKGKYDTLQLEIDKREKESKQIIEILDSTHTYTNEIVKIVGENNANKIYADITASNIKNKIEHLNNSLDSISRKSHLYNGKISRELAKNNNILLAVLEGFDNQKEEVHSLSKELTRKESKPHTPPPPANASCDQITNFYKGQVHDLKQGELEWKKRLNQVKNELIDKNMQLHTLIDSLRILNKKAIDGKGGVFKGGKNKALQEIASTTNQLIKTYTKR